jgi:uncharacterized phage-associated protein
MAVKDRPIIEEMNEEVEFNEDKLKELIIYIASKCENHIYFGAVKLNKILFYSDFLAYLLWKKPITGATYYAYEHGPIPTILKSITNKMHGKDIAEQQLYRQSRTIALRNADLSLFTAEEISLVDKIINILEANDADSVREMSHALLGWKAAWAEAQPNSRRTTIKKVAIPYDTIFVTSPPIDEFEAAHGLELLGMNAGHC